MMFDFFVALSSHAFLQNALFAGLLSSIAVGVTGTFVVIKRLSYLAGGLAHAAMGGIGIAYYYGWNPFLGGAIFSILASLLIGWVRVKYRQNEDTLISALWAVGMATGLIFLYLTPGYHVDLESYLFGNILMLPRESLMILIVLDLLLLTILIFFYRPLLSVMFDEEFATVRGIPVSFFYLLLMFMIAITVIILVSSVGLILVIALLTLPVASMRKFFTNPIHLIGMSTLSSALLIFVGLYFSYQVNLPSGPMIILLTGCLYCVSTIVSKIKFRRQKRRHKKSI